MAQHRFDPELVDLFLRDALDDGGQARLAEQVAGLLPFHAQLPTGPAGRLSRLVAHLGGDQQLLHWLDRFPDYPRLVARMFTLIALLDAVSGRPAVVTALRELREHNPSPPGLRPYLPPHTDQDTIASLSWEIESLLGDRRTDDAVRLAESTVELLRQITPRACELDPDAGELLGQIERAQRDLAAAAGTEAAPAAGAEAAQAGADHSTRQE